MEWLDPFSPHTLLLHQLLILNMIIWCIMYLGHSFMKDFGSPLFILASLSSEKEATSPLLKIDKTEILLHFQRIPVSAWSLYSKYIKSKAQSATYKCPFPFLRTTWFRIKKSKIEFTFGGWGATSTIHRKDRLTNDPWTLEILQECKTALTSQKPLMPMVSWKNINLSCNWPSKWPSAKYMQSFRVIFSLVPSWKVKVWKT